LLQSTSRTGKNTILPLYTLRSMTSHLLVVLAGTLFFLILCATVGISLSTRNTSPIVAAEEEQEYDSEGQGIEQPPVWIR
jgi:hypothetical protein